MRTRMLFMAAYYFIMFYAMAGLVASYAMPGETWRIPWIVVTMVVSFVAFNIHISVTKY